MFRFPFQSPRWAALAVGASLLLACDPEGSTTETDASALTMAFDAVGGRDALSTLTSFEVTGNGEMYLFGEGYEPELGDELRGSFESITTVDLPGDRIHTSWDRTIDNFGVEMPLYYEEVVSGNAGVVVGCDSVFGLCTGQMRSNRVAATRKSVELFNPHILLAAAVDDPSIATELEDETIDGRTHRVVAIDANPRPIRLYIDAESGQLRRAVTTEIEPILGDVEVEVAFDGWQSVQDSALRFPSEAVATSGGLLTSAAYDRVARVLPTDDAPFAVAEELDDNHDHELHEWGQTHSQWVDRSACAGVPFDGDQVSVEVVDLLAGSGMSGVYLFAGSHSTLLVEHDEGLILVEAPLHERRMDAVLTEVRKLYPTDPITHVVSTHHHYDHTGGLRRALAEGEPTLVVSERGRKFYEDMLAAPFEVAPDALSISGREVPIVTVPDGDVLRIGSGLLAVEVHDFENTHADDMVVTYLPALKQLFQSDLYFYFLGPDGSEFPLVPPFTQYAAPMIEEIETMGLDVDFLLGGHGFPVDWDTARRHIEAAGAP
ncbi:MAG: MBL fold metallo-hydrolase [Myxococcota bacterium]